MRWELKLTNYLPQAQPGPALRVGTADYWTLGPGDRVSLAHRFHDLHFGFMPKYEQFREDWGASNYDNDKVSPQYYRVCSSLFWLYRTVGCRWDLYFFFLGVGGNFRLFSSTGLYCCPVFKGPSDPEIFGLKKIPWLYILSCSASEEMLESLLRYQVSSPLMSYMRLVYKNNSITVK